MEHHLTVQKTARYFTYGNFETAENIWIVLHGYAQLPYYFIHKFHGLDPNKNFVVAPEGLNRFYKNGTSGRVGATWMTKEARLDDIQDNMNYLDQLAKQLLDKKQFKNKILLGFSQGGATAARWHQYGSFHANHFVLWASVFPPDLHIEENESELFNSTNYFIVGEDDEYFKDHIEELRAFYAEQLYSTHFLTFEGKHDIENTQLLEVINNFAK
ncbi:MAG: hypothetical protein H3C31_05315 [Brumimicrobium sp.]|nr:hypothetical protein [Brumimicrobium sp.]MCO5268321.1 hypothetical protein [Brumimicrobium sp.]